MGISLNAIFPIEITLKKFGIVLPTNGDIGGILKSVSLLLKSGGGLKYSKNSLDLFIIYYFYDILISILNIKRTRGEIQFFT